MNNERRTHKFIDSGAQVRIASEVLLYSVLFVALLSMVLFVPPFVNMFSRYSVDDHQAIAKELFYLNYSKWPLILVLILFIGLASVLFSHRIVGPGYQLSRGLNELNDRNVGMRIKLRKWDFLSELQEGFNHAAERWQEDIKAISQDHEKALSITRELRTSTGSDKAAELEKYLVSIENVLKSYRGL